MTRDGFPGNLPFKLHPEKDEYNFIRRQRDGPYEMCAKV